MSSSRHGRRRVVISGQAALSAAGDSVADLLTAVEVGKTLLAPPAVIADPRRVAVPVGELAVQLSEGTAHRLVAATLAAVRQAIVDAAIDGHDVGDADVVVGTGSGCRSPDDWHMGGRTAAPGVVDLADHRCGAIGAAVHAAFGLRGTHVTINTACSSGLNAVAHGWGMVRTGRAQRVICIGADELWAGLCFGFQAMGILAEQPCEPFVRSVGTSLGEGVGVVVLEAADVVAARGGDWHAEVVGVGQSADAFHPSKPDPSGRGPSAAIDQALACAGADDGDVAVVISHGTGTTANDTMERELHDRRFGAGVPLVAAKGIVGHTHGASGLVELPLAIAALDTPSKPDDGRRSSGLTMKNAWAMGGLNTSVLLRAPTTDGVIADGTLENGPEPVEVPVSLLSLWVPDDLSEVERPLAVHRVEWARSDLLTKLALVAVGRLLGEGLGAIDGYRIGLAFATQRGPILSWEVATHALRSGKPLNPALVPRLAYHAAASTAARLYGLCGPCVAYTSHAHSGIHALEHALATLETGRADMMLVVAADEYSGPDHDGSALRDHVGLDVTEPRFAELHATIDAPDARPGASAACLAVPEPGSRGTDAGDWHRHMEHVGAVGVLPRRDQAPHVLAKVLRALPSSCRPEVATTDDGSS